MLQDLQASNPFTGETGVVEKIDEDGDAYIQFTSIGAQWVKRTNFPDMSLSTEVERRSENCFKATVDI